MGREIKRVPIDFDWPLNKVWQGYVNPHNEQCQYCNGSGCTTARLCLDDIMHLLLIAGEDSLKGRNHPWLKDVYLDNRVPSPDMAELTGALTRPITDKFRLGHDAIDRWTAVKKIIEAAGLDPNTWGVCSHCEGHGQPPKVYALAEAWERTEPPTGEGWQVWETVSEGSPISPVFGTDFEVVEWLVKQGYTPDAASNFVRHQWSPSMIVVDGEVKREIECMDDVEAAASEPPEWAKAIAAVAADQLMSVEHVHVTHHVRRVQILCDGELLAETVFEDGRSLPALQSYFRHKKMMGLE